jgi:hypothetical protein
VYAVFTGGVSAGSYRQPIADFGPMRFAGLHTAEPTSADQEFNFACLFFPFCGELSSTVTGEMTA